MTLALYQNIPIQENNEPLIDLSKFNFILEPSYFNQGFAKDKRIFLREGVAKKLDEIQKNLKIYKFKIWDGFRPRTVQNVIYDKLYNEFKSKHPDWSQEKLEFEVGAFITPAKEPDRIPPHATGGTIDLTLVDATTGDELNMGTGFDYFGPEASSDYFDKNSINETVKQNRILFREAMFSKEFVQYTEEWWHFDYGNQLWALSLNKPFAIYGEAPTPKLI